MPSQCNTDLIQVTEGATGAAGIAGPQINILSIEGVFIFDASGVASRTYSYVVEKGTIWRPNADFNFTEDVTYSMVTLTNFLKDANLTDKFNVHIERKKVLYKLDRIPGPLSIPGIQMDIFYVADGEIRFRFINNSKYSEHWNRISKNTGIKRIDFSLLILGKDNF